MCGRVVTTSSPEDLSKYLDAREILEIPDGEDYNLAPTDRLPLVSSDRNSTTYGSAGYGAAGYGAADTQAVVFKNYSKRGETV